MTGHKKYIQFSGNMVQSPLLARARAVPSIVYSDLQLGQGQNLV